MQNLQRKKRPKTRKVGVNTYLQSRKHPPFRNGKREKKSQSHFPDLKKSRNQRSIHRPISWRKKKKVCSSKRPQRKREKHVSFRIGTKKGDLSGRPPEIGKRTQRGFHPNRKRKKKPGKEKKGGTQFSSREIIGRKGGQEKKSRATIRVERD